MSPFSFFEVRGSYNPFALLYLAFRILVRITLGRRRRDEVLQRLHWQTLSEFLDWLHLPEHLSESIMVKEVQARVKRKIFRHEPAVSSFLVNKHGYLFVDVGANLGYYSFLLYDNFEKIISVEPHPRNVALIERVKEKYNYNNVKVIPVAVSDKEGETRLYLGIHRGGHSLIRGHRMVSSTKKYILVKTTTLSSLLKHLEEISLVKVDVEGAEWAALKGAEQNLDTIKSWVIELHDSKRKNKLEEWLTSHGYRFKWIDFEGKTTNHIYAWRD